MHCTVVPLRFVAGATMSAAVEVLGLLLLTVAFCSCNSGMSAIGPGDYFTSGCSGESGSGETPPNNISSSDFIESSAPSSLMPPTSPSPAMSSTRQTTATLTRSLSFSLEISSSPSAPVSEDEETPTSSRMFSLSVGIGVICGLVVFVILLLTLVIITGVCTCRTYHSARREKGRKKRRLLVFSHLDVPRVSHASSDPTLSRQGTLPYGRGCVPIHPQSFDELLSHIPELPAVELCELQAYVESLRDDQAREEYQYVRDIDVHHYIFTAALKCNRNKNRYVDILANEFTRVRLHTPSGQHRFSDYINANYIEVGPSHMAEGYTKQEEYIAAQGPLQKTAADFWSMVWSENCSNIVMVTNIVEGNKVKCFKYWPKGSVFLARSLAVILQEEEILPDYTIRTFLVTLKDKSNDGGGETRQVTQFHFTAWPDHGVPDSTDSMVAFVRRVRSSALRSQGPIITHCSAGIGRTGTFIAIDVMLQKIDHKESLDIMNYVCRMRAQRNFMVQTSSQYMFIYEAVLHASSQGGSAGSSVAKGGECGGENSDSGGDSSHDREGGLLISSSEEGALSGDDHTALTLDSLQTECTTESGVAVSLLPS